MTKNFSKATTLVFVCAVLLRVVLSLVNTESNDNHLEVIRIMAYENRIPVRNEAHEAFQPKLYHATVAAFLKLVSSDAIWLQVVIAQLVSCAAGVLTLIVAYRFMDELKVTEKVRFLSFSLLALNPDLIGINAQATNDSFVILFVSLALYFGFHFFQRQRTGDLCGMLISAVLAGISKGNGLVVFIAILVVFGIAFYQTQAGSYWTARRMGFCCSIFFVSYLSLVPVLGPYLDHYRHYGSPFVINSDDVPVPFPHFFEKSYSKWSRPGVVSVSDAIFTFRFADLLRNPVISNTFDNYPRHRTSLWSQLYGRAHFAHFDNWPPSWQLPTGGWPWGTWFRPFVLNIGRLILLCALLPTALLVIGLFRKIIDAASFLKGVEMPNSGLSDLLLIVTAVGYIAFVIMYALQYRDFSYMKAIFVFPAFFAFVSIFAGECEGFYKWCFNKRVVRKSVDVMFMALLILYVADVAALIAPLAKEAAQKMYLSPHNVAVSMLTSHLKAF